MERGIKSTALKRVLSHREIRPGIAFTQENDPHSDSSSLFSVSCQVVIDTKANNGRRGRFSITDNRDGIFTVTMENLTTGDAGWYYCGIEMSINDPMFAIKLHVLEGKLSELLILI
eukprot:gi/632963300/ref/XP_007897803.1/ PREDICTED: CMRF35-like molecule 5 [Callorhinchus milii]